MILVIDNYDSFTYNLVQYLGELASDYPIAKEIRVERNDCISIDQIEKLQPQAILLSPGPGNPDQSGVCIDILETLSNYIPILGVCLGHQAIAQAYGGKIVQAPELMHGKTSHVFHNSEGIFQGLPNPLLATRYHSLIADKETLPKDLEITAWLEDGTIMGLRHSQYSSLQGVQFHPESVLTEAGHKLLSNFLHLAEMK
tara:strand:+ start:35798 stop:36394 length:597 start_codon:yes stop_codon:yes gene_type:complete